MSDILPDGATTQEDKRAELKAKFLEYYRALPVQKLAAGYIGRSEDTITNWKNEDSDFSDQIELAKAEWARSKVGKVRSNEWLLERVMKDHFSARNELTGKDGKDLPTPLLTGVINVPRNDGSAQTEQTNKED